MRTPSPPQGPSKRGTGGSGPSPSARGGAAGGPTATSSGPGSAGGGRRSSPAAGAGAASATSSLHASPTSSRTRTPTSPHKSTNVVQHKPTPARYVGIGCDSRRYSLLPFCRIFSQHGRCDSRRYSNSNWIDTKILNRLDRSSVPGLVSPTSSSSSRKCTHGHAWLGGGRAVELWSRTVSVRAAAPDRGEEEV
jgi:hypothetical protein